MIWNETGGFQRCQKHKTMLVLAVTLAASLLPQVRFSEDAPGPIVDAVTAGLKADPRIAAYVEVFAPKPADSNRYTAPFFYRGDPQLPVFPSKKAGHFLIAIPYRLPGTPSRLSLRYDGQDYPIEVPEVDRLRQGKRAKRRSD